ncbi:GNAT family N-acetyltransferase [Desulfovibrio mangrovi]|uniref:GNAT family N-acetyltransferase n=1 Tax=Desulfovibrio mangrovi TaxID=2976983 RepID=UPI00224726EB|nr:GNAT family N-acetyltransferase [Desulfovibrio mangrovi]UZP67075.1 GNAT family N-acetyltransferase [Desulfovibrio mangrovi]
MSAESSAMSFEAVSYRETVRESDAADVRRIVYETGFFTAEEVDVAEELVLERLAQGEDSGYFFVFAEREGVVLGYTCYGPTPAAEGTYDLYWIAVDPAFRHMGLGKLLLAETVRSVRVMQGRLLFAETSGMEKYVSTRKFYERTGFVAEAVLKDFYRPGDDKVIYRLEV